MPRRTPRVPSIGLDSCSCSTRLRSGEPSGSSEGWGRNSCRGGSSRRTVTGRPSTAPRISSKSVPWHNQEQEEVYFIVEGTGEMCLGEERMTLHTGQAVYIPHLVFHQLTNIGDTPLRMLYWWKTWC